MTSYQCYVLHVEVTMYVRLWSSPFTEVTCDRDTIHTLTRHWTISMNISCFYVCNLVIKFPSGVLTGFLLDLHSLLIMFYCLQTAAVVWHIKHKLLMFRCWHSYITPTSCEQTNVGELDPLTCCRCADVPSLTLCRTGRRTDETPRARLRVASSSSTPRSWCCKTRWAEAGEDERENQILLSLADYKNTPLEETQDWIKLLQCYKEITCWPQIIGTSGSPV